MSRLAEKETRRISEIIDRLVPTLVSTAIFTVLPSGSKDAIKASLRSAPIKWLNHVLEVQADRSYRRGKRPITRSAVRDAIDALPLPSDAVVFMHSSMSSLGYIEGGAATIASVLREVIIEGRDSTVAVPTFSMIGGMADTLRAGIVFDARSTPSGTGRITELIRRQSDARRSLHPTHSVAAVGRRSSWLVDSHHLDPRSFGPRSPFGRLIESDAFILGLGVDLGPVTFYHVLEDLSTFPRNVYTSDSPLQITCIDESGNHIEMRVMAHDPAVSTTRVDKPNGVAIRSYLTTVFENAAGMTWHKIGDGQMWLVSARRLYECLEKLKDYGITIYATAEEVASFPAPASVLRG